MLNQNDKLERFSAQINRTAEKTVQKIQKQTEKISNTQLETFRAEAQEELEERMTYAEGRLQREANGAVARQGAKRKQQAAQHREEIVADVFDRAKAQLSAFANTQDYQAFALKMLKKRKCLPVRSIPPQRCWWTMKTG